MLNKETLLADVIIKSITNQINELSEHTGVQIQKSNELVVEWKNHILALDQYIKSLST